MLFRQLTFFVLFSFLGAFSQEKFTDLNTPPEDYAGYYKFGPEEILGKARLLMADTLTILQLHYHTPQEKDPNHFSFYNVKNIRINGNIITGDNFKAKFVIKHTSGIQSKGLMIEKLKINGLSVENTFGHQLKLPLHRIYPGRFPQGSYEVMSRDLLKHIPSNDLRVMRNEIYARYGYEFKKGGEMSQYFAKQLWYYPVRKNVDHLITPIESHNVQLFQEFEKLNTDLPSTEVRASAESNSSSEKKKPAKDLRTVKGLMEQLEILKNALLDSDSKQLSKFLNLHKKKPRPVNILNRTLKKASDIKKNMGLFANLNIIFSGDNLDQMHARKRFTTYRPIQRMNYYSLSLVESTFEVLVHYHLVSQNLKFEEVEKAYFWKFRLQHNGHLKLIRATVAE